MGKGALTVAHRGQERGWWVVCLACCLFRLSTRTSHGVQTRMGPWQRLMGLPGERLPQRRKKEKIQRWSPFSVCLSSLSLSLADDVRPAQGYEAYDSTHSYTDGPYADDGSGQAYAAQGQGSRHRASAPAGDFPKKRLQASEPSPHVIFLGLDPDFTEADVCRSLNSFRTTSLRRSFPSSYKLTLSRTTAASKP
jgi:hypothetical protein